MQSRMTTWVTVATAATLLVAACSPAKSNARTPSSTASNSATTAAANTSATTASPTPRRTAAARPLRGAVIVVDPGHNGANVEHPDEINEPVNAGGFRKPCNTTGTETDDGYPEHALNWDVGKRLARKLRVKGAKVILTRKNDTGVGPCVNQRGRFAERHDADLLISIHADGSSPSGHGFAVLHPGKVRGYTTGTHSQSRVLATDVAAGLVDAGLTRSTYLGKRGLHMRSDLGTLNLAGAPAVMVEMGNMRNPTDVRMFTSPKKRARLARALAAGVAAFVHRR